ncbi:MAG TPA: copper resistance system multicopper oxidase [Parvularculaceae bacterium]|nr:copper resistance system multicopper oxidase [Parvularculaceae bacterium]
MNLVESVSRRGVLKAGMAGGAALGALSLIPAWARSAASGNKGIFELAGSEFDLAIGHTPVNIGGRTGHAVTTNGTLPGPLLRFREGERITLRVKNLLEEDTSIHWHGLLVPFQMDGVPGVSFPGVKPGETFVYEYSVPQSGTYWYHSHSGLQEQSGHYGPIIIDPAGKDPIQFDREYVLVLSDWSFLHPHEVFSRLKKSNDVYNFQQRTALDFLTDAKAKGLRLTIDDRLSWGCMRMSPTDIADVTGAVYTYLINGHATADNWTAIFNAGERVRLRIINASAMTIFNFRIPGLPMTVVAADGLHVQPVETDEFQIGVAETYDVIVTPSKLRAYALVAESIDRSGQVVATFAPEPDMRATAPLLRERPLLTHKDMAMAMDDPCMKGMAHGGMDHGSMAGMDHGGMAGMDHGGGEKQAHDHKMGAGVDMVAMVPASRLDEPGLGLENVPHRALRYSQLKSLEPNPDTREPSREVEVHLTGNMERFMWSFDGVKMSDAKGPLVTLAEGERVRFVMVNDTMMTHPIHLHGQFFEVVNGESDFKPRKHTINVKPGEKCALDFTANAGDWAFHCHLLFHMHAGMMQVVSVMPGDGEPARDHLGRLKDQPASKPSSAEEKPSQAKRKSAQKPTSELHADHGRHSGHGSKPAPPNPAEPAAPKADPMKGMDHGSMDHGSMDHGDRR